MNEKKDKNTHNMLESSTDEKNETEQIKQSKGIKLFSKVLSIYLEC